MSKVLVKYSGDWSDEFDVEEFKVFSSMEDVKEWLDGIKSNIDNGIYEFYFGSNEALTIDSMEEFLRDTKIVEISDEEAAVFEKYFGNRSFGLSGVFNIDPYEEYE